MANLQVRDMDDNLYNALRELASRKRRSISQEVVHILEAYLSQPRRFNRNPTVEFLSLCGSWDDDRSALEIARSVRADRKKSRRFGADNELFD